MFVAVGVEDQEIVARQTGQVALLEEVDRRAIDIVHVAALVVIEPADDPFERAGARRSEPDFLHEDIVVGERIEREGNGVAESPRKIDHEQLIEAGQRGGAGQIGEAQIGIHRQIVAVEIGVKEIGPDAAADIFAQVRIDEARILRRAVLVQGHGPDRQAIGRLPQHDGAAAVGIQRIGVLHAGADIVDPAFFVAVEADDAQRQLAFHDRHVHHRVVTLAKGIAIRQAEIDKRFPFEIVKVGAARDDAHRPGERVGAEQRALRSAQKFHPLDVEQCRVENGGVAVRRDRQFVDIDGDRSLQVGAVSVGGDAAGGEIVEVGGGLVHHHARRLARQAFIPDDALLGQRFLLERGDRQRHVLQAFRAPRGGHDDVAIGGNRIVARRLGRRGQLLDRLCADGFILRHGRRGPQGQCHRRRRREEPDQHCKSPNMTCESLPPS